MNLILNKFAPLIVALIILIGSNFYFYSKGADTTSKEEIIRSQENYSTTRKNIDEAVSPVRSATDARERLLQRQKSKNK